MAHRGDTHRRAPRALAALALSACALAAGAWPASAGSPATLKVGSNWGAAPELVKTLPISRHLGQKRRVVLSLDPSEVGPLQTGDLVSATGEVEVSVTCTEPMPQCVGTLYGYSPHVAARAVIADSRRSRRGVAISGWRHITCSQKQPNRNHHCVLVLDGISRRLTDASTPPCAPGRCYLNLVMSAYHPSARRGNVVVIGADNDSGTIQQDKGRMNAAVYRPGQLDLFGPASNPVVTTARSATRVPIAEHSGGKEKRVIYSLRLDHLQDGEQLLVMARSRLGIGHLAYSVLVQSQLIISEHANSISRAGIPIKVTSSSGEVGPLNGFNCTQGPSDFSDPCPLRKVGVVRMTKDAVANPWSGTGPDVPLYLNLVVDLVKQYDFGLDYRSGDVAKVRDAGLIKVHRYSPDYRR